MGLVGVEVKDFMCDWFFECEKKYVDYIVYEYEVVHLFVVVVLWVVVFEEFYFVGF